MGSLIGLTRERVGLRKREREMRRIVKVVLGMGCEIPSFVLRKDSITRFVEQCFFVVYTVLSMRFGSLPRKGEIYFVSESDAKTVYEDELHFEKSA